MFYLHRFPNSLISYHLKEALYGDVQSTGEQHRVIKVSDICATF